MEKSIFSKVEKRFMIVYFLLNSVALAVNYFGFNLSYTHYSYEVPPNSVKTWLIRRTFYFFTPSDGQSFYYEANKKEIYPFVDFYESSPDGLVNYFNGIFAYYDTTEFFIYMIPLIIFIVYKKFW